MFGESILSFTDVKMINLATFFAKDPLTILAVFVKAEVITWMTAYVQHKVGGFQSASRQRWLHNDKTQKVSPCCCSAGFISLTTGRRWHRLSSVSEPFVWSAVILEVWMDERGILWVDSPNDPGFLVSRTEDWGELCSRRCVSALASVLATQPGF